MALQTAALLVLAQNYAGDITRQINRRSVALSILAKNADEGKNVAWAAQGSGAIAEAYVEGADAANFATDSQKPATLPWVYYRSNFQVSGFAKAAARTSRTPEGNIELLARDMLDGVSALSDKINKDLYVGLSGQTPGQIVGFDEAIGLDTNTYATIDRTVDAFWKPYVVDPGAPTALTFQQIRADLAAIMVAGGMKPDIAFVGPTTHTTIAGLFDPQKQYVMQTLPPEVVARELPMYQGGAGVLRFDGCFFIEDKDAPEGKIYYVNSSVVSVQYLPHGEIFPGMADETMDVGMTDGVDQIPLGLRMEGLAKTGDADKVTMMVYPQLRVKRPNMCGVRKNISNA